MKLNYYLEVSRYAQEIFQKEKMSVKEAIEEAKKIMGEKEKWKIMFAAK